jgi:hypothetical protein
MRGFAEKPNVDAEQPFDPSAAFVRALFKAGIESAVRVCATFRPGRDPAVAVDVSSGIARFDAMALQTVSRAALRRVDQVPETRACYLFSAKLTRIPPLPVLACMLTANGFQCVYPFKEIAATKVTLDGVEPVDPP